MNQNGAVAPVSQDLVSHPSDKPATTNPFAHSANITLSVPETVEVRLVDASALGDYEVWVLLTSILSSAVTGFLVALVQATAPDRGRFTSITCVFGALMLVCGVMAMVKRRKLSSKARKVRFKVGEPIADQ
jgi:predicted membrane protein